MTLPADTFSVIDNYALGIWVRPVLTGTEPHTVISKEGTFSITIDPTNGQLTVTQFAGDCNEETDFVGETLLRPDAWQHLLLNHSQGILRFYLDGEEIGINTPGEEICQNAAPLLLGNDADGGNGFVGQLDDLRIYARPLLTDEIESLVAPAPLHVFHWNTLASGAARPF